MRATALIAVFCIPAAFAQPTSAPSLPRTIEVVVIPTSTPSIEEFLGGKPSASPATVAGELRIPTGSTPKVPAVILMHGAGGFTAGAAVWAQVLNENGIATLALDSTSGRKGVSEFKGFSHSTLVRALDAYRALAMLSADPRIDAKAIYVMGFSNGAYGALQTASTRFTEHYGGNARFAGHFGLYSVCNYRLIGDTATTGAPILMFHGTADEVAHIERCRTFAADMKTAGANITMTEFAGVHHQFDNPNLPASLPLPAGRGPKGCSMKETETGVVVNVETGKAFDFADACTAPGVHLGYSASASGQAQRAVIELIKRKAG